MQPASYEFFAPPRIVFGWGRRAEIGTLAATLGKRAFIVTGSRTLERSGQFSAICDALREAGIDAVHLASISHEPEVSDVDRVSADLAAHGPGDGDLVIGLGGGSALDLAKAVAAMATNRQSSSVVDYLEGVGQGLKIANPPLPILAMPTTAGTGSEATKNAVISSYAPPFKKSLRSDLMVPRVVLVDPDLSVSVPPDVTAHTGMDAITQLIESYISRKAKPIPRALAIQGLRLAMPALAVATHDGTNRAAREAMAHAALLSGMALANSGLGLAHGVAAALGASCKTAHGLACAVMLPVALKVNRAACEPEIAALARGVGISKPSDTATVDTFIEQIEQLAASIGIPKRLGELGVDATQIPALVRGSRGNSMDGNPVQLTDEQLADLLRQLL